MRAVYVNPNDKSITEVDVDPYDVRAVTRYVKNPALGHHIFPVALPEHDAFVNREAIAMKEKVWYFARATIWGPVLIFYRPLTGQLGASTVSVDFVGQHTRWAAADE